MKYDKNIQVEMDEEAGLNNTPNRKVNKNKIFWTYLYDDFIYLFNFLYDQKTVHDEPKEALPQKSVLDRKFSKIDPYALESLQKAHNQQTSADAKKGLLGLIYTPRLIWKYSLHI